MVACLGRVDFVSERGLVMRRLQWGDTCYGQSVAEVDGVGPECGVDEEAAAEGGDEVGNELGGVDGIVDDCQLGF